MKNTDRVVKRQALLEAVWGFSTAVENNTLDAFIRLLRKKVDRGRSEKLLHTVRGFGYLLGCN
jgi:DNA-binding response OmpR family regulator